MSRSYISEYYCDIKYIWEISTIKTIRVWVKKKKNLRIFRIRFQTLRLIILSCLHNIVSDLTNYHWENYFRNFFFCGGSTAEINSIFCCGPCLKYNFGLSTLDRDADVGRSLSRFTNKNILYRRTGTNIWIGLQVLSPFLINFKSFI